MACYAACLIAAMQPASAGLDVQAWAPSRRALGRLLAPLSGRVRYYGRRPPADWPALYHATTVNFPSWRSGSEVATVHDLYNAREALHLDAAQLARRTAYIRRADALLCVSEATRKHLHALLDIPRARSRVVRLAVDSRFAPAPAAAHDALRRRRSLPAEFLLYVGGERANKNLDGLVRAYAASGLDMPLYLAGRHSAATRRRLRDLARAHRPRGAVRLLGVVHDRELPVLMSAATALCLPSTFEGFGLPIVEAMACGTSVLTSRGGATEETANGFAVLVDPHSIESMAEGLRAVIAPRAAEREAARRYATARSWRDVARETLAAYSEVLGASTTREKP